MYEASAPPQPQQQEQLNGAKSIPSAGLDIIMSPLRNGGVNGNSSLKSHQIEVTKEDVYDPYSHRELSRQYSNLGAFLHLLKVSLGSGIMAMPMAFQNSGLALGVVATIVTGAVCTHCMIILVRSAQTLYPRLRVPTLGMGETAEAAFASGPKRLRPAAGFAKNFVMWSLFSCYAMAMSAYTLIIASSIKQVVDQNVGREVMPNSVYVVLLALPLLPLCQIRHLKHLVPCSFIANTCLVAGFAITVYYLFDEELHLSERRLGVADIKGMPIFFATALFAMEGIGSVMPIENTMRDPRQMAGWSGVMTRAMICIVFLFASLGFMGYLRFGDDTMANIALNLPTDEIPAQVVKLLLAVALVFTVPVQFLVCADILWSYIVGHVRPERHFLGESLTRALLILACIVLALVVPNLNLIISLVGAIFFSALGIFTPAVVETVTYWEISDRATRYGLAGKNGLLVAVSLFTAISGVYAALYEALE